MRGGSVNSPFRARSFKTIGDAYERMTMHAEALIYYKVSLQVHKAIYGNITNHPEIAILYADIGDACLSMRMGAEGLKYHRKSLEMRKAVHGEW